MFINEKLDNSFLSFACAKLKFKIESECNVRDSGIIHIRDCNLLPFSPKPSLIYNPCPPRVAQWPMYTQSYQFSITLTSHESPIPFIYSERLTLFESTIILLLHSLSNSQTFMLCFILSLLSSTIIQHFLPIINSTSTILYQTCITEDDRSSC